MKKGTWLNNFKNDLKNLGKWEDLEEKKKKEVKEKSKKENKEGGLDKLAGIMAGKDNSEDNKLKGIGGWLIFPIIGFIFSILIILSELLDLTTYSYESDVSFFIMLDLGILVLIGITLYQIFNKRKNAPKWAIISLVVAGILNLLGGSYHLVIVNIIWITYFLSSKRVKNTFIE